MAIIKIITYWGKKLSSIQRNILPGLLIQIFILSAAMKSCETERTHESPWFLYSISGYIEANQEEFSYFNSILKEGRMVNTLYAYNPYSRGYTLFLPTDEAIDQFIQQSQYISSIGELLLDTGFLDNFVRYHTLNEKVHTVDFPFGALTDRTLTGDRLVVNYFQGENNLRIEVNNTATIIKPDIELVNGYIHVISEVLQPVEISGYEWIQQEGGYSILAQAMTLCGIRERMWMDEYTILAEHDSIYQRNGIYSIDDLITRVGSPGIPYSNEANSFYQYTAYHVLRGEYYLNDLEYGDNMIQTMSYDAVTIDARIDIRINPGVDTYSVSISDSGDTTIIDYISPVWEYCNILTHSGPVHSITELLVSEALPDEELLTD